MKPIRSIFGKNQGISKYYTTQVAPSRVETLRKIGGISDEIKFLGNAPSTESRNTPSPAAERVLTGGKIFDPYILNLLCESGNFEKKKFLGKNIFLGFYTGK